MAPPITSPPAPSFASPPSSTAFHSMAPPITFPPAPSFAILDLGTSNLAVTTASSSYYQQTEVPLLEAHYAWGDGAMLPVAAHPHDDGGMPPPDSPAFVAPQTATFLYGDVTSMRGRATAQPFVSAMPLPSGTVVASGEVVAVGALPATFASGSSSSGPVRSHETTRTGQIGPAAVSRASRYSSSTDSKARTMRGEKDTMSAEGVTALEAMQICCRGTKPCNLPSHHFTQVHISRLPRAVQDEVPMYVCNNYKTCGTSPMRKSEIRAHQDRRCYKHLPKTERKTPLLKKLLEIATDLYHARHVSIDPMADTTVNLAVVLGWKTYLPNSVGGGFLQSPAARLSVEGSEAPVLRMGAFESATGWPFPLAASAPPSLYPTDVGTPLFSEPASKYRGKEASRSPASTASGVEGPETPEEYANAYETAWPSHPAAMERLMPSELGEPGVAAPDYGVAGGWQSIAGDSSQGYFASQWPDSVADQDDKMPMGPSDWWSSDLY
ncbi:hypothetical protein FA95DRAFT_1605573 [Auriscalpium vulgare]|uniref:Uncharacterized protein n=1 Tax=Auriscalpium vulgare TaxID=40419 RepID=A0ACB8RW47_9AGAM|nr:hypothetical protein FA95DRAFT_1605573 [Auriscalpium vulgare]